MSDQLLSARDAALRYASHGWPVMPTCWPVEGRCGCPGRYDRNSKQMVHHEGRDVGKAPDGSLVPNGVDDATTNPAIIAQWWREHPLANVSVALHPAGLLMVDPDSDMARADAYKRGIGFTILRHSRNDAFLFQAPADCPPARVIKDGFSEALDILSDGYALVHGTHANGDAIYLDETHPIGPAPEWAVKVVEQAAAKKAAQERRKAERAAGIADTGDEAPVRLHARGMKRWTGELVQTKKSGETDTSDSLFFLGLDLAECNASRSAIVSALAERDVALGWSKYTDRNDADDRYGEIADKAIAYEDERRAAPDLPTSDEVKAETPLSAPPTSGGDGAQACINCARLEKQAREQAGVIEVQKERIAKLLAEVNANSGRFSNLTEFRQANNFSGKRKDVVEALAIEIDAARKAGKREHVIYYGDRTAGRDGRDPGGIASRARTSPSTVETTVNTIRDQDGSPWKFQTVTDRENGTRRVVVKINPDGDIASDLAAVATLPRATAQHGGSRPRCPDHPTAALIVQAICADCGQVVSQTMSQPSADPLQQDTARPQEHPTDSDDVTRMQPETARGVGDAGAGDPLQQDAGRSPDPIQEAFAKIRERRRGDVPPDDLDADAEQEAVSEEWNWRSEDPLDDEELPGPHDLWADVAAADPLPHRAPSPLTERDACHPCDPRPPGPEDPSYLQLDYYSRQMRDQALAAWEERQAEAADVAS